MTVKVRRNGLLAANSLSRYGSCYGVHRLFNGTAAQQTIVRYHEISE